MPLLTEEHARAVGSIDFELQGGGTGAGFRELLDGNLEIAAASRPHLPADEEQAQANAYSLDAEGSRGIVAIDIIALSVHPSNPLSSLLGHEDQSIRPITRDPASGTRALFEDFFCGPKGIDSQVEVLDHDETLTALATDPTAITYHSATESMGTLLGLRPDSQSVDFCMPSQQNIISGRYPLYMDLYLYTAGPAVGPAAEFQVWIASPAGQEIVDEARFVPLYLRPERMDEPRPLRETVHFEQSSSDPNQRSMARLDMLVEELRDRSGEVRHVVLEGYTDSREPDAIALSQHRAEAVETLLSAEMPGLFYEIIPRGAVNPIAPNETPYGRLRNRRVQIYLAEEEQIPQDPAIEEEVGGE